MPKPAPTLVENDATFLNLHRHEKGGEPTTWERVKENWPEYQESAKHAWGKLSRIELIPGDRDKLVHKLEDAYGFNPTDAEREVDNWQRSLS